LTLEITETAIMADKERLTGRISDLRDLGVEIAMDDFGTGYSSMSSLAQLPISAVKLDRSFVKVIGEGWAPSAVIRAIVTLCKVMNLKVVAEGVETQDQFTHLFTLGCDLAQGYLFSEPLTEPELLSWLASFDPCIAA